MQTRTRPLLQAVAVVTKVIPGWEKIKKPALKSGKRVPGHRVARFQNKDRGTLSRKRGGVCLRSSSVVTAIALIIWISVMVTAP
jgi:hypothetical protein